GVWHASPIAYWHFGSPSLPAGASDVDPMKIEQVLVVLAFLIFAVQPSAVVVMVGAVLPVDWVKMTPPAPIVAEYLTESARYASSFVLANFGIAIAARMPMITTTISSSMSVKPLRFMSTPPCRDVSLHPYQCRGGDATRQRPSHGRDAWRERVGIEPTEAQT